MKIQALVGLLEGGGAVGFRYCSGSTINGDRYVTTRVLGGREKGGGARGERGRRVDGAAAW